MAVGAHFAWTPKDPAVWTNGTIEYPEAATQTFKRGTPVVLDSNGRIAACGASPASIFGVAATAGQNGSAGQYTTIVIPLRANQLWRMSLLEALTQNLFGQSGGKVGIVKDATTGFWYASTADTGDQVVLVDYVQGPAGMVIGDTIAPVYVEFVSTVLQVF